MKFKKGDLVYYIRKADGSKRYGVFDYLESASVYAFWGDTIAEARLQAKKGSSGWTNVNVVFKVPRRQLPDWF